MAHAYLVVPVERRALSPPTLSGHSPQVPRWAKSHRSTRTKSQRTTLLCVVPVERRALARRHSRDARRLELRAYRPTRTNPSVLRSETTPAIMRPPNERPPLRVRDLYLAWGKFRPDARRGANRQRHIEDLFPHGQEV